MSNYTVSTEFRTSAAAARRVDVPSDKATSVRRFMRLLRAQAGRLLGQVPDFAEPDLSQVQRLVFVCTTNLHRSAFAQAVAEQAGLNAVSFGLHAMTGQRTIFATVRAAAALGCRLEHHRATHCRDFEPATGDLYLVMDLRQAHELVRLGFPAQRISLLGRWSNPWQPRILDLQCLSHARIQRCFAQIRAAVSEVARVLHVPGRTQFTSGGTVH